MLFQCRPTFSEFATNPGLLTCSVEVLEICQATPDTEFCAACIAAWAIPDTGIPAYPLWSVLVLLPTACQIAPLQGSRPCPEQLFSARKERILRDPSSGLVIRLVCAAGAADRVDPHALPRAPLSGGNTQGRQLR